jgi:hexosaminidase
MKKSFLFLLFLGFYARSLAQADFAVRGSGPSDFAVKGFHLDLRIQVMRMPALKALARDLHQQGINTLVMEWEASYPFEQDPQIANRYVYTRAEIKEFIGYCHQLGIDVIPLQQSFGHVEYILRHNKYAALREDEHDLSQVCPARTELNRELFTRLFKDMAATHGSPYIHIGCDETHLLGHCPLCKKLAAEEGVGRLYFDHVKLLCDIVVSLGKRPVLWADIALKYPEYIHLLPASTVFVDWNYGWDLDRFGDHAKLVNSGYEIWGSPALRSDPDNYYLTRWQHHFDNVADFIPQCRRLGYKGIVMTSWSTSGVYDPLFNADDEVVALYPVRHVYPLSGFRLLVAAYTSALSTGSFEVSAFIRGYCHDRYGLDSLASGRFLQALFNAPYTVVNGKVVGPVSLGALLDSARVSARILHGLKPVSHLDEFEHYRLMADIRVYYLSYMVLEGRVDSAGSIAEFAECAGQLRALMATEESLDAAFDRLNGSVLYPAAIREENAVRVYRTHELYERVTGSVSRW